ncbi:helix-turn-helix domain-containing protein [Cucumibacter marinus]|uniref:helix-turn-helix domain-containing protein n=1 Tax=Cucumibacter marinus TaxID=1121252 RepID=UPI000426BEAA|nr:XRE family transcriptional regulator [Cucumibacter marinus]
MSNDHGNDDQPEGEARAAEAQATADTERPLVGANIRARRRQLGMTLQQLCDRAELSVGYLSQIERDNATPSLATLAQIATSLGVGVDYFIAQPKVEDALTRASDRPQFSVGGSSIIYERLGAEFPGNTLSGYIMHVPPGYVSETVHHEGEEIIYVLEGTITQFLDGETLTLRAGDCLHYRGNRPHAWSNPTEEPARLLWTGTLTLFHSATGSPAGPADDSY